MLVDTFKVVSPNVTYSEDKIESTYRYDSTRISRNAAGEFEVVPTSSTYEFAVDRRVPKLGCAPCAHMDDDQRGMDAGRSCAMRRHRARLGGRGGCGVAACLTAGSCARACGCCGDCTPVAWFVQMACTAAQGRWLGSHEAPAQARAVQEHEAHVADAAPAAPRGPADRAV